MSRSPAILGPQSSRLVPDEELQAVANKLPWLVPVCQRLRELIQTGFGDSFLAQQLVEYIARSGAANEASSWRARLRDSRSADNPSIQPVHVKAELEALADKQPSLAPVCQHLRDLTEAGFGDGFFARQLVEQIAGSVPASEANSWRARIATVLHDQPDRSENGKVDEGKHISAKAHRLRAKLTPAKRPSRRVA